MKRIRDIPTTGGLKPLTRFAKFLSLSFLFIFALVAIPPGDADAADVSLIHFAGSYEWSGESGTLDVRLDPSAGEPADGEAWDIAFHFTFRERTDTYRGTAVGALDNGQFEGRVKTARGHRYSFRGTFEDGVFSGKHYKVSRSGKESENGTLTFG